MMYTHSKLSRITHNIEQMCSMDQFGSIAPPADVAKRDPLPW